jgi:hypothetical protein
MDGYKHYIRVDSNSIVTFGYSDAFPEIATFQTGDICIDENAPRQFNLQLVNLDGKYIYKYVNSQMVERTADELFDLSEYKQDKINLLSVICNETILGTFTSSAMGTEHTYVFDMEAQMNFAGTKQAFKDSLITTVEWNTRDAGVLVHDSTQFNQLWLDGFTHKMSNITKFRTLKGQIYSNAVTTKNQVDTIAVL